MRKPLVTLIVRSMGRASLIDALASIALQRYRPLELVVADATGGRHPPLPPLAGLDQARLVSTGRPLNRPAAANLGLDEAGGEWVGFLDDDDFLDCSHVDRLVTRGEAPDRPGLVYAQRWDLDRFHRVVQQRNVTFNPLIMHFCCQIVGMSCLIHRRVLDVGHRLDETFDASEDWDFWLRLMAHARFATVDEPTHFFFQESGTSGTGIGRNRNIRAHHVASHDRLKARHADMRVAAWKAHFANLERGIALHRQGDHGAALALYHGILREAPDEPNAMYLIGRVLEDMGQLHGALARYRAAIYLNGDAAEYHVALGDVCSRLGDIDGARDAYAVGARLAANIAPAMTEHIAPLPIPARAMAPEASGEAVPRRNSPCPCGSGRRYKVCHGLGPAWSATGEPVDEVASLITAMTEACCAGDSAAARRLCDQALATSPRCVEALHVRGLLAWDRGDLDFAHEDTAEAARLQPGDAQIVENAVGIRGALHERALRVRVAAEIATLQQASDVAASPAAVRDDMRVHLVASCGAGTRERIPALLALADLLATRVPLTLWSAAPEQISHRVFAVRHLDPEHRDVPALGTIVFYGSDQVAPAWLAPNVASRLIVVQDNDDSPSLLDLLRILRTRTLQPIQLIATPEAAEALAGIAASTYLPPLDLDRYQPAPPAANRRFTIGRASANDHRLFHPQDAALLRGLARGGDVIRLLGGTNLMRHFPPSRLDQEIELLPSEAESTPQFLQGLDCLFFRTRFDGRGRGGRVVAKALACGLPVVCASTAGYAGLVVHGVNGFVFEADDDGAALSHLAALREDLPLRRRMSTAARLTAERVFGPDAHDKLIASMVGPRVIADRVTPDASRRRVTIIMTARERHSLADSAIQSVLDATQCAHRFLYLDTQSPAWLRARLDARAARGEIEVVRFDAQMWPQEMRARVAGSIDTEYAVFIDNDVAVERGSLEALVACADETGAGIVGPLYLAGGGRRPATIHMAGGQLTEIGAGRARVLMETHRHVGADPAAVAADLVRAPCDFVEFHCMLIRVELLRNDSIIDVRMRCVHEHIDCALAARRRGFAVVSEPAARVTYLGDADYRMDELPYFRSRWTSEEAEANIALFCQKWNVVNEDRSFGGVRQFVHDHVAAVDPIRPASRTRDEGTTVMNRDELAHTRSDLLDTAASKGYVTQELEFIAGAYHVAHVLTDGGYRPCERPFIDHLVGTASVLVHYGFRAEIVAAGLLHSAYTHSPVHPDGAEAALAMVRVALGGKGHAIESRVRAYALRGAAARPAALPTSLFDGEMVTIEAADELDMHLAGEFRYSGRDDGIGADAMQVVANVCATLGVAGLHESLRRARSASAPVAPGLVTGIPSSYRISADRTGAVAMAVNDLSALRLPDF